MAQSEDFREASNVISVPTMEGYFCGRPIVEFGSVVHHVQQPDIVTFGSDGDDVIIGTANDDRIFGRQGDDCIFGLDGDDELRGFQGSDVIFDGNGNDELFGNQGDDILRGQAGFDTYEGGQGEIDVCENLDGDTSFSRCEIIEEREHPVVIAAGDLACRVDDPLFADGYGTGRVCVHGFVAGLAKTLTPTAFLALGDFQSGAADPSNWQMSYDKSWGRLYNVTYPTRGDGEAYTAEQQAYADYFNSRFNELTPIATDIDGEIDRGSYSVQIGDWHIVSIDTQVNTEWLSSDLAAATSDCKLAAMHMPATSSGQNFDGDAFLRDGVGNPWNVLNEYKVAAVLSGDDHHYERFKPQTVIRAYAVQEDGETWEAITAEQGAVQFIVGTGGQNVRGIPNEHPNTAIDENGDRIASNEFLGFLELTLKPGQADYRFIGYTPWPKSDADRVPISQYTTDYQGYQIHTPVAYEVRDEGTFDCNTSLNTPWIWTNNGRDPFLYLKVGDVYSLNLTGLGWDTEADVVTFRASGLPPGLSLSGDTISGTPSETGVYDVELIALDAGTGLPSPYQITIQVDPNSECLNNGRENDDGCLNDGRLNDGRTQ